jgi:eukaryotic-like serine/threonine-protein kinase
MISRRIGRYEIDRLLGEGGVGRVYAARDTLLERQVAIKTLRPEASRNRETLERFINEAKSSGDLRHPNIVTLYDLVEGQVPCIVMELVDGHTLEELLEWVRVMPTRESLAVVAQAAAGLSAAHQKDIIHRDIKPANLMITVGGLVKIMDFGIARVRGSQRLTRADQVFATLLYASPEQLRGGDVDGRSDLYSLAAVLYEMLSGSPPFTADSDGALRQAQLEMQPPALGPLVPGLNPRVEAGVMRALAKHPRDRFTTVEEFADAIGASALRGDSANILQAYFTPILERARELEEVRPLALHSDNEVSISPLTTLVDNKAETSKPPLEEPSILRDGQRAGSMRRPMVVLSSVIVALLFGIGYVVWSPKLPMNILEDKAASARHPPPATPTKPNQQAAPTAGVPPPARPQIDGHLPEPSASQPDPERNVAFVPPQKPILPNPAAFDPSVAAPTTSLSITHPKGVADVEGTVSRLYAADMIYVGGRPVQLYGIQDTGKTVDQIRNHQEKMKNYLQTGKTYLVCYTRPEQTYQCYADGNDIAEFAIAAQIARRVGE